MFRRASGDAAHGEPARGAVGHAGQLLAPWPVEHRGGLPGGAGPRTAAVGGGPGRGVAVRAAHRDEGASLGRDGVDGQLGIGGAGDRRHVDAGGTGPRVQDCEQRLSAVRAVSGRPGHHDGAARGQGDARERL